MLDRILSLRRSCPSHTVATVSCCSYCLQERWVQSIVVNGLEDGTVGKGKSSGEVEGEKEGKTGRGMSPGRRTRDTVVLLSEPVP